MSKASIIVNGLKVKFEGRIVLDAITFQLSPGQHLAITGSTGSGKSSLAKAIAGNLYYQGEIIISGVDKNCSNAVLYIEQNNQFKNLSNQSSFYYQQRYNSAESEDSATVLEELAKYNSENNEAQIIYWLRVFNLIDHLNKPLIQLSNGEHKKLQIIKALLRKPSILILDQPFTGLDAESRDLLKHILNNLSLEIMVILISARQDFPSCITHVLNLDNKLVTTISSGNAVATKPTAARPIIRSMRNIPGKKQAAEFNAAIDMRNVTVRYDDKIILHQINWKVLRGEKWLVSGPNGSGKSTLLSLVNGDNPQAYANDIFLFDKKRGSGESIWDIKKKTGFISPELHWYFDKGISVADTIASGFFDTMGLYKKLAHEQKITVSEWLEYFNLVPLQHKSLNVISSGYQRLVLLARALIKNPALLILDEPCQGLDDEQTQHFIQLIDDLYSGSDKTLIYINHYQNDIPFCINRKLTLQNGHASISATGIKKVEAA